MEDLGFRVEATIGLRSRSEGGVRAQRAGGRGGRAAGRRGRESREWMYEECVLGQAGFGLSVKGFEG